MTCCSVGADKDPPDFVPGSLPGVPAPARKTFGLTNGSNRWYNLHILMALLDELRRTPIPVAARIVFGRYASDKTHYWHEVIPQIPLEHTHAAASDSLLRCADLGLLTLNYYRTVKAVSGSHDESVTPDVMLRERIARDLVVVDQFLRRETGLRLIIMSGYRSPLLQRAIRATAHTERGVEFTDRMFSDPDVYSPHATGAALDIELWDDESNGLLPMKVPDSIDRHTLESAVGLTATERTVRDNRRVIYHVLANPVCLPEPLLFVPHPYEYWHYGRHERLSAFFAGEEGYAHPVYYGEIETYVPR